MNRTIQKGLTIAISVALLTVLWLDSMTVKSPILYLALLSGYCLIMSHMDLQSLGKNNRIIILIFSVLFSVMLSLKRLVVFTGGVAGTLSGNYVIDPDLSVLLRIIVTSCALYPFFCTLAGQLPLLIVKICHYGQREEKKVPISVFVAAGLSMMAVWTLGYLCFFPGTMVWNDILYVLLNPETAADVSPIVFNTFVNLFLKWGVSIQNPNLGFAAYCIVQMVLFGLLLSYVVYWLYKINTPLFIVVAVWLFYTFYPIISLYSFTIIRDVGFSAFMLLWLVILYDVLRAGKFSKPLFVAYVVVLVGTLVSRSNGKIIAPLMALVMPLFISREKFKILAIGLSTCIVTFICLNVATRNVESRFIEAVGVPVQQIAMVINEDGVLSEEDKEVLFSILPEEDWRGDDYPTTYVPMCVDMIKGNGHFDGHYLNTHKSEFIKTYLNVLFHNPWKCIKAYLLETYGFWALGSIDDAQAYHMGIQESEFGFTGDPKLKGKLFDFIRNYYFRIMPNSEGSAATFSWLLVGIAVLFLVSGKQKYCLLLMPMLLNWMTIMVATPIAFAFRYVFYYLLAFPALFALLPTLYRQNLKESG